jgi:hypothetical protein
MFKLRINDRFRVREIHFYDDIEINLKYDSLGSTFKFSFFFDPDNFEHKEMCCVAHYHIVSLYWNNELILTGFMTSNGFNDTPEPSMTSIGGYSLPGVLQDCAVPLGEAVNWIDSTKGYFRRISNKVWPGALQSDRLSLRQISEKICNPFGLEIVVDPSVADAMDELYDETTAKEKQSAKSYICELANQKNIVVTDDPYGRIVFTRPQKNPAPLFHFDQNIPGTSMGLVFNGPGMHSHIRVYQQQDIDEDLPSSQSTVENPYVFTVFRPDVGVQTSGDANDTLQTAKNKLAKEMKNLQLTINTDRWGVNNKIWRPGKEISVTNKKVYLYKKSNWLIEEVTLKLTAKQQTSTLKCVPPSVYNGADPDYLFQGINIHAILG